MTMLSFRVAPAQAEDLQKWSETLGIDRSELLREALRRQLRRLRSESEASTYEQLPHTGAELALGEIANWGPAEDWSDWSDAKG